MEISPLPSDLIRDKKSGWQMLSESRDCKSTPPHNRLREKEKNNKKFKEYFGVWLGVLEIELELGLGNRKQKKTGWVSQRRI